MVHKLFLSRLFILVGVLLTFYSMWLFVQSQQTESHARDYSDFVSNAFSQTVTINQPDYPIFNNQLAVESIEKISIDDNLYLGMLSIPSLNLNLPVQSEFSDEKLKNTPCVYKYSPFTIVAHDYESHFGKLVNIKMGETVIFTDTSGIQYFYQVELLETVWENQVDSIENTDYDLTLFTCDYTNYSRRFLVRLNLLEL